jgi:hypothetical protein
VAYRRYCLQHRPQLADRRVPNADVCRLEQADSQAGQAEGQELGQPRGGRRQRSLLYRRRRQCPGVSVNKPFFLRH